MLTTNKQKHLLIVDDEPNITSTVSESLDSMEEFQVDVAHNGQVALEMVSNKAYDIVLTDYKMPGMSGLSLALAINKIRPRTQIIMMTGYGSESLRASARLIPVSGFLEKPCSIQQIREAITQALYKDPTNQQLAFVIEDNLIISNIFSRALEIEGYRVETIQRGDVAQKRLEEETPRLVLLDLHLPGVDGGTLLSQIRNTEHLKDAIVFVATGDNLMSEMHMQAADMILQKPVTFSQLCQLVRRFKK